MEEIPVVLGNFILSNPMHPEHVITQISFHPEEVSHGLED